MGNWSVISIVWERKNTLAETVFLVHCLEHQFSSRAAHWDQLVRFTKDAYACAPLPSNLR